MTTMRGGEALPHGKHTGQSPRLVLFTGRLHTIWGCIFGLTLAAEIAPAVPVDPAIFYIVLAVKALLFLLLGLQTPLTFWPFYSIGRGLLFSVAGAFGSELLQMISPGHKASMFEFAAKSCLLLLGFALGLAARYDMRISLGKLKVDLENPFAFRSKP